MIHARPFLRMWNPIDPIIVAGSPLASAEPWRHRAASGESRTVADLATKAESLKVRVQRLAEESLLLREEAQALRAQWARVRQRSRHGAASAS